MDQILLELVRYVITLPADASIAWRFALLVVVVVGVWATARERRLWLESHQRFIDRATPEQLDAYKANPQIHKAKHKQLAPPSNGGPLVLVLAFCALGLSGEHVSYAVSRDEYATTKVKSKCKPECEAPSVCRNGSCVAPAIAPPPVPKPLSSPTSGLDPWAYDPRPPQLRIPNS